MMIDMLHDVNAIRDAHTDPEGYLRTLEPWSEKVAEQRAAGDGLTLGSEHWDVVHFLRAHFRVHGPARHARDMAALLERQFAAQGGRRYLYRLFPKGPVTQASRFAGLPMPAGSVDLSFGTVH